MEYLNIIQMENYHFLLNIKMTKKMDYLNIILKVNYILLQNIKMMKKLNKLQFKYIFLSFQKMKDQNHHSMN